MIKKIIPLFILACLLISPCCRKDSVDSEKPLADVLDSLIHDGVYRSFYLHIPTSYNEPQKMPLVIALHGYTSSAIELHNWTGLSDKADEEGFMIVYPNGLRYPWDERNPRAWNCGEPWEGWTQGTDDVGFIERLIDLICQHYNVDENCIYVTGHSNGSRMTYRLGVELACRIAAIAPHSGQLVYHGQFDEQYPVPVLHLHAQNDETVNYEGYDLQGTYILSVDSVLSLWASRYSCITEPVILQQDGDLTIKQWNCTNTDMDVMLYLTTAGNHSWFTESNSGISANDIIWDFFSSHAKN